jgi:transcriptional regulator with XRE-family HTH domain
MALNMAEFTYLDLRKAREVRKLTRWQLANKIGVSEDTVERWETGKQAPTPDDVGHIEDALDAVSEMLWERWMYSNVQSYREHHAKPQISGLLAAIVGVRQEMTDVLALQDKMERDARDGVLDDVESRARYRMELEEVAAVVTQALALIGK